MSQSVILCCLVDASYDQLVIGILQRSLGECGVDSQEARAFLLEQSWLSGMPLDFRHAVVSACHFRWYDAGQTIAYAGMEESGIFALAFGSMAVTSTNGPRDAKLAYIMRPGFWTGMVPLFTGSPRTATHVARERTLIAHLEASSIKRMLDDQPGWWRHFGHLATIFSEAVVGFASDLLIQDSRRRCIAVLLHSANVRWGTVPSGPIAVQVSQDELGAIGGLSRKTVGRFLKELERQGLVEVGYREINLINPGHLRHIANGD